MTTTACTPEGAAIVKINCRKTGQVLATGPLEYRNQFCVEVIKTYPNGAKGRVTYLAYDVDVAITGNMQT